jgi:hypothetical protein
VPTPCLADPKMVENLLIEVPSVHIHTVVLPFYFVTQPDNTESHLSLWDVSLSASKFEHFYSIFVEISFDMNTKEYTLSKWAYWRIDSQLFFQCVDVLKFFFV